LQKYMIDQNYTNIQAQVVSQLNQNQSSYFLWISEESCVNG